MFPVAILIASVAMTFGIGGAAFFSPFFQIVIGLRPEIAIALGILIEVFGFGSGLVGYAKAKLVNYHLSTRILPFAVGFALLGAYFGKNLPSNLLEIFLAVALFALAVAFLSRERSTDLVHHPLHPIKREYEKRSWTDFWRDFESKPLLFVTSSIGGLFVGLVSIGLGEVNAYNFVRRLKMDPATSAGSSVFIVALTTAFATLFNLSFFAVTGPQDLLPLVQIAIWAIPGVVLGGQLGVRISKRIDRRRALLTLPILFAAVGILTLVSALS